MDRYICIHGHFYQPPRENPWLEAIEVQDSAYPYHDWNERTAAECYGPNAASRILDGEGRIVDIVNNYAKISFDVGPTLLGWLERFQPGAYEAILAADLQSRDRFGGHGSAMAQAYSHMIMPLANERDRRTQVRWGVADFESRFGRQPEGMWLPETAVDLASLEALVDEGIRFTVLEPGQARAVRPIGGEAWEEVEGGRVDPTRAYVQRLPSGREIALFFYDGPIARAVAFEHLLTRGDQFAERLLGAFHDDREGPQLVHIATDGETYGHHHAHGDMGLAYALRTLESDGTAQLTNYGQFLELHPPTHEVRIIERTAWSCSHGLGRWTRSCGCSAGGRVGWDQAWREPLREALDWLRDAVADLWPARAGRLLSDPWMARDAYIEVVLDRSSGNVDRFLSAHGAGSLSPDQQTQALELLELQRHAMLMYTSCGWFFDELSGLETVQVIQYAGRVVQLARDAMGIDLRDELLKRLAKAKSNTLEHRDGWHIYEKFVEPAALDLQKVCSHFALSSLFAGQSAPAESIYCYDVTEETRDVHEAGPARLVLGAARVTSRVTRASQVFSYGAVHFGDHSVAGGVRPYGGQGALSELAVGVVTAFRRVDFPHIIRLFDRAYGDSPVTLRSLFRDEQRKVVDRILEQSSSDAEMVYQRLYERRAPLLRFLADVGIPVPRVFGVAAEIVLNNQLRRLVREESPSMKHIIAALAEAEAGSVPLDVAGLGFAMRETLIRAADELRASPDGLEPLRRLAGLVGLAVVFPFEVPLWDAQNAYWELLRSTLPRQRVSAQSGDAAAAQWLEVALALAGPLHVAVETVTS